MPARKPGLATAVAAMLAALLAAAPGRAQGPHSGHVFVSNEKSNSITVLDGVSGDALRTIETCMRPRGMRFSQDRGRI